MIEIWKPIIGYKKLYSISNLGRVRRDKEAKSTHAGYILKINIPKNRYPKVTLSKLDIEETFHIHKLVTMAFFGKRPNGYHVNHKDGNKNNNNVKNLEYVTPKQNICHAKRLGLNKSIGETHPFAKLTNKEVLKLRNLHKNKNIKYPNLAKMFGISVPNVRSIVLRRLWKHI